MGLGIALRAFSAALFNKQAAENIRKVLERQPDTTPEPKLAAPAPPEVTAKTVAGPVRSEAITLLSALQREARLVDLIQEDLAKYSDAQVGAAARPCLQQCAATLSRLFDLKPVHVANEGDAVELDSQVSPERYQWIGEGDSQRGKLVHHGWLAAKTQLPEWTGSDQDACVIAAAQIQKS